jgi:hypothetical protein
MASRALPHLNLGQRQFLRLLRELAEQHRGLIGEHDVSYKENAQGQLVFAVILRPPAIESPK